MERFEEESSRDKKDTTGARCGADYEGLEWGVMRGREELFELDGERAGPFQVGDACAVGAILRWLHDSRAARDHRGEVGVAIKAVEANGGDAVVGRGIENQRKRTEL